MSPSKFQTMSLMKDKSTKFLLMTFLGSNFLRVLVMEAAIRVDTETIFGNHRSIS